MRIFFTQLLIRLLSGFSRQNQKIDNEKMEEWIKSLESNQSGYKMYYTWRKKHINDSNALALDQKEYWMNCGRLAELQYLNMLTIKLLKDELKK